jgi:hypothetical protein
VVVGFGHTIVLWGFAHKSLEGATSQNEIFEFVFLYQTSFDEGIVNFAASFLLRFSREGKLR